MDIVGLKDKTNFLEKYLYPAIDVALIEPINPNSPKTDPKQKYRLTQLGKEMYNYMNQQ